MFIFIIKRFAPLTDIKNAIPSFFLLVVLYAEIYDNVTKLVTRRFDERCVFVPFFSRNYMFEDNNKGYQRTIFVLLSISHHRCLLSRNVRALLGSIALDRGRCCMMP